MDSEFEQLNVWQLSLEYLIGFTMEHNNVQKAKDGFFTRSMLHAFDNHLQILINQLVKNKHL
jgi:hypothetical protein